MRNNRSLSSGVPTEKQKWKISSNKTTFIAFDFKLKVKIYIYIPSGSLRISSTEVS